MFMTLEDAIEMVLTLARENIALTDDFDASKPKGIEACNVLEDFLTNHLYDEAAQEHEYRQQFMSQ
jgi:hypothetical protein